MRSNGCSKLLSIIYFLFNILASIHLCLLFSSLFLLVISVILSSPEQKLKITIIKRYALQSKNKSNIILSNEKEKNNVQRGVLRIDFFAIFPTVQLYTRPLPRSQYRLTGKTRDICAYKHYRLRRFEKRSVRIAQNCHVHAIHTVNCPRYGI